MPATPFQPERRKEKRTVLHLPVQVQGHDAVGTAWMELTTSEDVSRDGVGFSLARPVVPGSVLRLSLPLPAHLRAAGAGSEAGYRAFAHVRHTTGVAPTRVGCLFLGETAPAGYAANPGGRFLLPSDPQPAYVVRRRFPRFPLVVAVRLRRLTAASGALEEATTTEDIGQGGLRVRTTLPIAVGELVQVEQPAGPLRTRAVVQGVTPIGDGASGLSLEFTDPLAADQVRALLRGTPPPSD